MLPNGRQYNQPTPLFINNEFVTGSGSTITVLNPALVPLLSTISFTYLFSRLAEPKSQFSTSSYNRQSTPWRMANHSA